MFKYIKNLIPAKTSIATGIVFKSPDIERIKFKNTKPQLDNSSQYSGSYSAPVISEDRDYIYLDTNKIL